MRHFKRVDLGWSNGMFSTLFEEAKEVAVRLDCTVTFEFNGVKIFITKNSTCAYTFDKVQYAIQESYKEVHGE